MKKILVLGAGGGGTILANGLAHVLFKEIDREEVSVQVIGENDQHVFQPAFLDVAFKGADPQRIVHDETTLLNRRVEFLADAATRVNYAERKITTKQGKEVSYDYLVLATGAAVRPDVIPGLSEGALNFHTNPFESSKIWKALQGFKKGKIVVAIASVPHKCPPSPNEAAFMIDEFFRRKGIRDSVDVKFLTPYPRAYPSTSISEVVQPMFEERKIEVVPFFNTDHVDPVSRKIYSMEGEDHDYDLLIAIPPHRGTEVAISSGIGDEEGWIPADKRTMVVKDQSAVFAIGDSTNIPTSKSGVVAHLQALTVAQSIESDVTGTSEIFEYNGRINCPMETGHHRALFVSGTYDKKIARQNPTFIRYVMKKSFGKMYWSALSGSWDWLFGFYFGKTSFGRRIVATEPLPETIVRGLAPNTPPPTT